MRWVGDYWAFYGSLLAYLLFIVVNMALGLARTSTPIRDLSLRHAITLPFAAALIGAASGFFMDVISGAVYFFLFHYAVGLQLFSVAQRSVSTNLLILIKEEGPLTESELRSRYGRGRGFGIVSRSRLDQMIQWDWIRKDGDGFVVTPKGLARAAVSAHLLAALSLRPLGERSTETENA